MEKVEAPRKINTHGKDLFLIGMIVFVLILALTVLAYKGFIRDRVKNSEEYRTAVFFASSSSSVQNMLLAPLEHVVFDDLWIKEEESYGVCYVTFDLFLQNNLTERLGVGLVKVADFWIVYDAVLGQGTPAAYTVTSTYDVILTLLETLESQSFQKAWTILDVLKNEIKDPSLYDYLTARVKALDGHSQSAVTLLNDLLMRVKKAKPAVLFERAMIYFDQQAYDEAAKIFQEILVLCQQVEDLQKSRGSRQSLFADLPKDPLITAFDYRSLQAVTLQNLALTYFHLQDDEMALQTADQALEKAGQIDSSVITNVARFIKAMSFYALKRLDQADQHFALVIENPTNANLSQKAWAYYYRGLIADEEKRLDDSLDYFETAVNLDPFNFSIRKGAILYLAQRGAPGDTQIALAFALRGVQYNVEKTYFQELAARLSKQLGIEDVSGEL